MEETACGIELIAGATIDYQFGPVILFGAGGTGVEIYRDTTLRMAPLSPEDVTSMLRDLKVTALLEGHRGSRPVHLEKLIRTLTAFSELVMDLEGAVESVDINPLMCSAERCVAADARIMLVRD